MLPFLLLIIIIYNKLSVSVLEMVFDEDWNRNFNKTNDKLQPIMWKLYEAMKNSSLNSNEIKFLFSIDDNNLKFDLNNTLKNNQYLIDAELYVYKSVDFSYNLSNFITRIYQILPKPNFNKNPDVNNLLNVVYTSAISNWQIFKVKNSINNWLNKDPNLGFLITATDAWENKATNVTFFTKNFGIFQPFLILYIGYDFNETASNNILINSNATCKKKSIYIDFKKLKWNNFIIAPDGFNLYECEGNCNFKDLSHNRQLLKIIKQMKNETFESCCAPSSYTSLPIMFHDNFNNIVIKKYEKMIVESCSCY